MGLEQHTEDIGWLHHLWDEVGPRLVTGVSVISVALIGLWATLRKRNPK